MAHWINHRTDIPKWLAAGIGEIAAEWSALEWQLEEVIRLLLPLDITHGRIITTGMNMRSRFTTAINLAQSHLLQTRIPLALCEELSALEKRVTNVEEERNKLVHGLWGQVEGQWYLLWQRQQRVVPNFGQRQPRKPLKLRRAVLPDREHMTPSKTGAIWSEISACAAAVTAYCASLEVALPPSPHISPRRLRQTIPRHKRR